MYEEFDCVVIVQDFDKVVVVVGDLCVCFVGIGYVVQVGLQVVKLQFDKGKVDDVK